MPSNERGSADSGAGDQGGTDVRLGDRPVLRLFADDGRIRVGLVMPVLDRVVDISVQPSAACGALEDEGRRQQLAPQAVEAAARRAIDEVAEQSRARRPAADQCLLRAFGGAAFPLLGDAYDLGGQPLDEVPRWAEPVLRRSTVGDGATDAFGTKATRPVKRALVDALAPLRSGEIDLTVLALALMGVDALDPDRLARVLRADRVAQPANHLPDPATVRSVRPTLARWGAARTERILADAAQRTDGLRLLVTTVRYAQQLADHGPEAPLPNRLAELHAAHRSLLRGAPAEPSGPTPQRPVLGQPRAVPPRPAADRDPTVAPIFAPPATPAMSLAPGHRLAVPSQIRRIDGMAFGDLSFAVPATVGDLVTWSEILRNCLDEFGPAVATGRSIILGVVRRNRLAYALELDPQGRIRQFTGHANRPPPDSDRLAVAGQLVARNLIDTSSRANAHWLRRATDRTA